MYNVYIKVAFSPVSVTRGHAYKLYKPQCVNAVRKKLLHRKSCKRVELPASQCRFFITIKFQMFYQPS